jgi:hypothetical protein
MKQMFLCGDSYMTPSPETPGQHFGEILSKIIDYELVVFSRGGMSNGGIAVQIESAIASNASFILVNTTMSDRIEIPINASGYGDNFRDITVDNIMYRHPQSISSYNKNLNNDPILISDTLQSLLPDYPYKQYENHVKDFDKLKEHVKVYFSKLYEYSWKRKLDKWCIYAVLHKLEESKIPYILMLDELKMQNQCSWLTNSNYINNKDIFLNSSEKNIHAYNIKNNIKFSDPGYHTLPIDQITLADQIHNHLLKHQFI